MTEKELNKIIYLNIQACLKLKKMHMKDLERCVGVGEGYFSRKQLGGAIPILTLLRVSEALEMPHTAFLNKETATDIEKRMLDEEIIAQAERLEALKAKRAEYAD